RTGHCSLRMMPAERSGGSPRNVDMAWLQRPPLHCILEFLHCFEDRKHKLPIDRLVYPAYGFYESLREGKGKVPIPILTKDRQLFTFWEAIWCNNGSPPAGRALVNNCDFKYLVMT